ncbi:MAG: ABC transporter ATP-binding protein/permease [candidate division Zixibacteria bacterium]|nr:ABC transporter ATP-binding protein/permease [candidate division Zixibacteria bacterium]MBU1470596.1 ABC transporter ATP-binding protein/permease [candidate division Zixibacteria bacterium]MBU2624429.1 ABC transporter ATP-binding protein/permease [candidate division Zixibacteria bacterium]
MPTLRRVIRQVSPYWKHVSLSAFCMVMFALLSGALIWMIGPLLRTLFVAGVESTENMPEISQSANGFANNVTGLVESVKVGLQGFIDSLIVDATPLLTLKNLCIVVVTIAVAKALFFYLQGYLMAYVEQRFIKNLRDDLFIKFQRLSLSYFHGARTGELLSRVTNDVNVLRESLDQGFNRIIREPLLILIFIGFMTILSWKLTIVTLVVLPVSFYLIYLIGKALRRVSARAQARMADVNSVLEENVSNMRVVKAFGAATFEIAKFMSVTEQYFRALLKISRMRLLSSPVNEFLGTLAGVVILWYGGRQVLGESLLKPEDFMLYVLAMFSIIAPAKSLSTLHVRVQEGLAAADRIFDVLDTPVKVIDKPNAKKIDSFKHEIRYESVSFEYDTGGEVLRQIDFNVKQGEIVAVVGPSGAGKSTLLDLLPRFYDPTKGRITIDGTDLRDLDINSLRALFGIVTQETMLFNDSVYANIAYGLDKVSKDGVVKAAEIANAHDFISSFENEYETPIGNRGVMLSGGQRQRIAIARAILRSPQILIFDEATSALDTESEQLVQEAIDRLMVDRTVLVIAHRLSTILHADKILVLGDGRLIQSGTHEELVNISGLYQRLYNLQFKVNNGGIRSEERHR